MAFRASETYRKDLLKPPGHGYGRNTGSAVRPNWVAQRPGLPTSVIIHTTSNANKGTKVWNEATFLRDSPDVSCHDLIAKDGTVYVILPPEAVAWHAGTAQAAWSNYRSIGYELHCSVGEEPTAAQLDSLAERVRAVIAKYDIARVNIETHRAVAVPRGRKQDPEGLSDAQFYAWRDALYRPPEPDWAHEWGRSNYNDVKLFAIPTAWRDAWRLGTRLGRAISDELQAEDRVVQVFQRGLITWNQQGGAVVRVW